MTVTTQFLSLTFGISLLGFACVYAIPAARSPESPTGLPFWLVMVWGPSLAAMIISYQSGNLGDLLGRTVQISTVPVMVWAMVATPILFLLLLRTYGPEPATPPSWSAIVLVVGFNLILGPLGEELGWRGLLQEQFNGSLGWLTASLIIGVIWFVWHLPLWAVDSPHAQITMWLFGAHVIAYAVIIGAAYTLSGGSILSAILLHLSFNVAANLAAFYGYHDPDGWFRISLPAYAGLALASVVLVYHETGQVTAGG